MFKRQLFYISLNIQKTIAHQAFDDVSFHYYTYERGVSSISTNDQKWEEKRANQTLNNEEKKKLDTIFSFNALCTSKVNYVT
jgi:hypothetical protein